MLVKSLQVCHCVQGVSLCKVFYKPLQVEKVLTDEELTVMFINWKELRLSSMKLMKSVFESVFKQGQLG